MRKPAATDGDRRQQIVEAALDVFAEYGFEKATTKEIATRVGVAQGLVYFYFSSKVELFLAACEHQTQLALVRIDALETNSKEALPQVALRNLLKHFVQILDEPRNSKLLRLIAITQFPVDGYNTKSKLYEQQFNVLIARLNQALLSCLQSSLPAYPYPEEIVHEADFFSGSITTVLVRRALNHPEDREMVKLSQEQLVDLLASNLFGWLTIKQAMLLGNSR
jgi:AcrR family transcriptional regulator